MLTRFVRGVGVLTGAETTAFRRIKGHWNCLAAAHRSDRADKRNETIFVTCCSESCTFCLYSVCFGFLLKHKYHPWLEECSGLRLKIVGCRRSVSGCHAAGELQHRLHVDGHIHPSSFFFFLVWKWISYESGKMSHFILNVFFTWRNETPVNSIESSAATRDKQDIPPLSAPLSRHWGSLS